MSKLTVMYFSPSGTTKKALETIARGMGFDYVEYIDLTDFNERWQRRSYTESDLVMLGIPTYEGRLAGTAKEIFNRTIADKTPFVGVITYGNRAYEDALLEMKNSAKDRGFEVFAAGAFVCQHSLNNVVGLSRPDIEDEKSLYEFGKVVAEKFVSGNLAEVDVPGSYPYKLREDPPIAPTVDETCISCLKCAQNCPVLAINPLDAKETDNFRCIMCGRCVSECAQKARSFRQEKFKLIVDALTMIAAGRKEPETFV